MMSLRLMFSVVPGALYVLTGGLLLFYSLHDSKLKEIKADLEGRRAAEAA